MDFDGLDRFGMDFDGVDWNVGDDFVESAAALGPGSFGDISGYNPNAAGLIGEPKAKKLQETAGQHAPKGGVSLAGKQFKGGEFIPGSMIDRASPQERKALKQKQEAAKTGKESPTASEPKTGGHSAHGSKTAAAGEQPASAKPAAAPHAGPVSGSGAVRGSAGGVEPPSPADPKNAAVPLAGLPRQVKIKGEPYETGPFPPARLAAIDYMKSAGLSYNPPKTYAKLNKERAKQIADAFEQMPNAPDDPKVKAAYRALIDETLAQYQAIKKTGLKIDFIDFNKQGDPYAASPRMAEIDVKKNNHLWVFPTDAGFGSSDDFDASKNPLLEMTNEYVGDHHLCANDVFRIVHDYFGHIKEGNGFRAEGEENAWRCHSAMYSPLARQAMTTETRGQNSYVNYGPNGDFNRTASAADTKYADQKVGILPAWCMRDGSGQPGDPDLRKEPPEPAAKAGLGPEDLLAKFHKSGGFSYQPAMKDSPTTGYCVSFNQEHEKVVPGHELTPSEIQNYMNSKKDVFEKDPTARFGAWYDAEADKVYLDISHVVQDKDEAVKLAREHNQEAIYDFGQQQTVFVKRPEERRIGAQETEPGDEVGLSAGRNTRANPRGDPEGAEGGGQRPVAEAAPPDLRAAIKAAADATNTEPTPAPIEAGTYKKGKFRWNGLTIAIENPKGSVRRGTDEDGNEWESAMDLHYGYVLKSEGADGDHVDVFVGPKPESELVFVVDQLNGDGSFNEHKALIGFDSEQAARDGYLSAYEEGWDRLGAITAMTLPQFINWLDHGNTAVPVAIQESAANVRRTLMEKAMASLWESGKLYP